MPRSISSRLALMLGVIFLIFLCIMLKWFLYTHQVFANEVEQNLHRSLAYYIAKDNKELKQGIIDEQSITEDFHAQMLLGPEWEFYALDMEGKILAYSAPDSIVKLTHVSLDPIQQFLRGKKFPIYGDNPRNPEVKKVFSTSQIKKPNGETQGYLYVIIGSQKRDTLETLLSNSLILSQGVWILFASVSFGFLVLILAILNITQPLKQLSQRCKQYVSNKFHDFETRSLKQSSIKEIRELETSFIKTARHIHRQLTQIQTTEKQRRQWLSHVSHDFRTPLAAMNGYLETWLLTHQAQENSAQPGSFELIHLALKNGHQLRHLVDQLFELALLENGSTPFQPEPINLLELIQDVKQRMKIYASQKGINLILQVKQPSEDIIVMADIAKLERILVNLINNAIRHTPKDGTVGTQIDTSDPLNVTVHIVDTGIGIPPTELNAVFEPRYKASNSQGKATEHAGLGLSIVKHLVELHQSHIEVKNRHPTGCEFSFQLPRI